jgi:hypothetical protein
MLKRYKYAESLQFLKPYFTDRGTITNIDTDSSTALEPDEMEAPRVSISSGSGSQSTELHLSSFVSRLERDG